MAKELNLERVLTETPPAQQFIPYCCLSRESDTLTVYFEGDADYSRRLTEHVTIYLSIETDEIVGCRIKGISSILEDLPNFLRVNHGGVELSVVFLAFRGGAEGETREALNDLARVAVERQMVFDACP